MEKFSSFALTLQNLFGPVATQLAFSTGFRKRASKLNGAALVLALVGGWLTNPKASRAELAQWVGVSKQALDQSLNEKAANFLGAMVAWALNQLVQTEPKVRPLLDRFKGVYVLDSTVLSLPPTLAWLWPGCGKEGSASAAGLKLHVGLELVGGTLIGPEFSPARTHDRKGPHQNLNLPSGALRLSDLGYFKLERFKQLSAGGVYFISKVQSGLQIYNQSGRPQGLGDWLAAQNSCQIDQMVRVGVAQKLECRLVAWRVPNEVVEKRQASFKELERKRQRPVSAEQRTMSYWTVYLTNLSGEQLKAQEAAVLYRVRWQIELLFKLWKSEGGLDQYQSKQPWTVMCELYAKLLGQIVQHWLLLQTVWQSPEPSLVKATRVIRQHLRSILGRLGQLEALLESLKYLSQDLAKGLSLEGSKRRPCIYRLLAHPPDLPTVVLN